MIYRITEVMHDVRVALDLNYTSSQLLAEGDVDTLSMDEVVRSKIPEAVRRVHASAPAYMLEGGHSFGDALYWEDKGCGRVLLPDDFLRLIVFRMSDWERPVYAAISTEDPEYAKQSSRFRGIRGTAQKPVCAIGIRPEGRVLEFYSCKSTEAYVAQGLYMPEPEIDGNDGIDISTRCYMAVVYMVAALTASTTGDAEQAGALVELSKSALQ